jgi:hypothetical protein
MGRVKDFAITIHEMIQRGMSNKNILESLTLTYPELDQEWAMDQINAVRREWKVNRS